MTTTTTLRQCAAALLLGLLAASASAKIPPPQLTDEQKVKAAEAAARTAWSNQVANFQLCRSMDKVAARYFTEAKAANKDVKPAVPAGDCTDPGPFAYKPPEAKPLEAAGAHSPPETAKGPPNSKATSAEIKPTK
jgi:hypothetical protein